jgi:hypothetical protein
VGSSLAEEAILPSRLIATLRTQWGRVRIAVTV